MLAFFLCLWFEEVGKEEKSMLPENMKTQENGVTTGSQSERATLTA
jgi:hypothetical protein